jgi:hypothetical protein
MTTRRRLGVFALLGILALAGQAVRADESSGKAAPPKADSEGAYANVAGMNVAIDAATGRMRPPTAQEAQRLRAGMREFFARVRARSEAARGAGEPEVAPARPVLNHGRDGQLSALLGTDKLKFTVLTLNPDGSRSSVCVTGPDAADRRLAAESPVSSDRK